MSTTQAISRRFSTMSLVGLRRAIDRYLAKQKRSPFEYIVLATLTLLVGAIIRYPNRAFGTRDRPDLKGKGRRGVPLFGNLFQIIANSHDPLGAIVDGHRKYGNVTTMTVPILGRFIAVNTVEHMEYILKTNMENYIKGDLFSRFFSDLLGQGIFTSDGQQWRFHRKTASNIFTTRLYRDLVKGAFRSTAGELAGVLERKLKHSEYPDLQKHFHALTLDAFARLTFGLEFHAISAQGTHEFGDAFDYMTQVIEGRSVNPFWPIVDRLIPGKQRKIKEAIATIDRYAYQAIEARRKESEEEKEARSRDLLDHFINYEYDDGSKLTDEELRDVFTNFMIAGRDTTAQGLTWSFYMLLTHPAVLAKLREELDAVFHGSDEFTYEQIVQDLPYAKAVFYETLRLYSPVPKNAKIAVNDDVLPDGTRIYAGDIITFSNYALSRNTEVWGEDAERFNPDRWLIEDEAHKTKSPFGKFKNESTFKFISFNAGPRICLGQTFATIEALTTMAYLLQKFDFKLAPDHPIPVYKPSVTFPMEGHLLVEVSKRESKK